VSKSGSEASSVTQASAASTLLEKYRLPLSKLFVAIVLLLIVFTGPKFTLSDTGVWVFDSIALLLLLVACLGRVWCTMYIGGQKNTSVVSAGPYSMVRNPLYCFSFIGALGLVLMTHSIVIAALLLVFFIGIYPYVVAKEEENLMGIFGEPYAEYCKRTPRFIPAFKQYSTDGQVPADVKRLEKSLFDSGAFVVAFIALTGIRLGHETGFIPVLFTLP
jgi:protein-S-isoprenylcysteine O-methyltransferase Ste14